MMGIEWLKPGVFFGSLLFALAYTAACWAVAAFMDRRRWVFKL